MNAEQLSKDIDFVSEHFAYMGWLGIPITRRRIASQLLRGFDYREIYSLGVDRVMYWRFDYE